MSGFKLYDVVTIEPVPGSRGLKGKDGLSGVLTSRTDDGRWQVRYGWEVDDWVVARPEDIVLYRRYSHKPRKNALRFLRQEQPKTPYWQDYFDQGRDFERRINRTARPWLLLYQAAVASLFVLAGFLVSHLL